MHFLDFQTLYLFFPQVYNRKKLLKINPKNMANSGECSVHGTSAAVSRGQDNFKKEESMLRNEFEVMRRCNFTFIKEIGARNADEYVLKITTLEFLQEKPREKQ